MGTFSPVHWFIAIALVAALGAFVYFVGSLLWAGAKAQGKGKLIAAAVLLPLAVLAIIGIGSAGQTQERPEYPGLKPFHGKLDHYYDKDGRMQPCTEVAEFLEMCKR